MVWNVHHAGGVDARPLPRVTVDQASEFGAGIELDLHVDSETVKEKVVECLFSFSEWLPVAGSERFRDRAKRERFAGDGRNSISGVSVVGWNVDRQAKHQRFRHASTQERGRGGAGTLMRFGSNSDSGGIGSDSNATFVSSASS